MRRAILLGVAIVALSAGLIWAYDRFGLLPPLAAWEGERIDALFRVIFAVMAVIFALVVVLLGYSVLVFRRRPAEEGEGAPVHGNVWLEAAWTLVPLVVVVLLGVYGGVVLGQIRDGSRGDELVVDATAVQYGWLFDYPVQGIRSPELRLPVGRSARLRLRSRDVIHSFWVPEFRVKQDAVPGLETALRITPSQTGEYRALCAEACGVGHAFMTAKVVVLEPEAFEAWASAQRGEP